MSSIAEFDEMAAILKRKTGVNFVHRMMVPFTLVEVEANKEP